MLEINVAVAQLELLPGDLDGNRDRIVDAIESAAGRDADVSSSPSSRPPDTASPAGMRPCARAQPIPRPGNP